MKDKIQYEKAQNKLNIVSSLLEGLTEYNNLNNYTNNKKFTFKIDYVNDTFENCYIYKITLTRGLNYPKIVLDLRLQYKEKINDLLLEFIEKTINSKNFHYLSFASDVNKCTNKFSINLKGDVSIDFAINDEEDLKLYQDINKKYKQDTIIISKSDNQIDEETKDELQKEKAEKTINIIKKILDSLNDYNNLDNYENYKPFKLVVSNNYIKNGDYNKCTFVIVRGDRNPVNILELSLSIKDISIIYNRLYEIMLDYICKDEFIYNSMSGSYNKTFNIHLKNGITLDFKINSDKDELFYTTFFKEYRREALERKENIAKKKLEPIQ